MTNAAIATLPAPPPAVPFNGLGMFYASGDVVADPVDRAKLVLEAGATTAFVLTVEGDAAIPVTNRMYEYESDMPDAYKQLTDEDHSYLGMFCELIAERR
jgi:hypothetical protein